MYHIAGTAPANERKVWDNETMNEKGARKRRDEGLEPREPCVPRRGLRKFKQLIRSNGEGGCGYVLGAPTLDVPSFIFVLRMRNESRRPWRILTLNVSRGMKCGSGGLVCGQPKIASPEGAAASNRDFEFGRKKTGRKRGLTCLLGPLEESLATHQRAAAKYFAQVERDVASLGPKAKSNSIPSCVQKRFFSSWKHDTRDRIISKVPEADRWTSNELHERGEKIIVSVETREQDQLMAATAVHSHAVLPHLAPCPPAWGLLQADSNVIAGLKTEFAMRLIRIKVFLRNWVDVTGRES
ncbi:hypothetical protein C8R45DRAFT_1189565 [Mycena sanguinolenta]|nr:hypothetical protein C8R45DRAFT_1189565 [Mycena sanguinolenta]